MKDVEVVHIEKPFLVCDVCNKKVSEQDKDGVHRATEDIYLTDWGLYCSACYAKYRPKGAKRIRKGTSVSELVNIPMKIVWWE